MKLYDFDDFLRRMSELDRLEIIFKAEQEGRNIEQSSFSVKGCVERRKMGSVKYAQKIKEFLFFMHHGIKPAGVDEQVFQKYVQVIKPLVEKGQLKPGILGMFSENDGEGK